MTFALLKTYWRQIAIIIAFLALTLGCYYKGHLDATTSMQLKIDSLQAEAQKKYNQQLISNEEMEKQHAKDKDAIEAELIDNLAFIDELQSRATTTSSSTLPPAPADCTSFAKAAGLERGGLQKAKDIKTVVIHDCAKQLESDRK